MFVLPAQLAITTIESRKLPLPLTTPLAPEHISVPPSPPASPRTRPPPPPPRRTRQDVATGNRRRYCSSQRNLLPFSPGNRPKSPPACSKILRLDSLRVQLVYGAAAGCYCCSVNSSNHFVEPLLRSLYLDSFIPTISQAAFVVFPSTLN